MSLNEEHQRERETAIAEVRARIPRGVNQAGRGELFDGLPFLKKTANQSARRRPATNEPEALRLQDTFSPRCRALRFLGTFAFGT